MINSTSPHVQPTNINIDMEGNKLPSKSEMSGPLPTERSLNESLLKVSKSKNVQPKNEKQKNLAIPTANIEITSQ
jgi:hypothetical protein